MLLPNVTSVAAVAIIFAQLFHRDFGLVNWVLGLVGLGPDRLAGADWSLLDRHLHDGRLALDRLQRADLPRRHAGDPARTSTRRPRSTAPAVAAVLVDHRADARPTIIFSVIVSTIGGLQLFTEPLLFDNGANATGGGPAPVPDPDHVPVREPFDDFSTAGYAAAVAWVLFLLIAARRRWSTSCSSADTVK